MNRDLTLGELLVMAVAMSLLLAQAALIVLVAYAFLSLLF